MPAQSDHTRQVRTGANGGIPPDEVLGALDAVVRSAPFSKAKRPARFLRYLVETSLRGEGTSLKESVLGTDVFERPATWDPRLDPVVRQEAARLRKRLANYYESSGADAEVRIELPVGGYVPQFRRRSVEPEPVVVETPAAATPVLARRRTLWPYVAAAILCVAAALLIWRALSSHDSVASIAVLPFTDLTADASTQYFADGLTDEITDSLARLKTLRVIARSSAFQFKGKTVDIREAGKLLHVGYLLDPRSLPASCRGHQHHRQELSHARPGPHGASPARRKEASRPSTRRRSRRRVRSLHKAQKRFLKAWQSKRIVLRNKETPKALRFGRHGDYSPV